MKKGITFFAMLAALWFFFIALPAMVLYHLFFRWKKPLKLLQVDPEKAYFMGHEEEFRKAYHFIKQLPEQEISMKTKDGVLLKGRYCKQEGKKVAILLHGYRSDAYVNLAALSELLWNQDYDICLLFSRGHSPSQGSCSMGMLEAEDLIEWIEWIREKYAPEKIIVGGVSLGASIVSYASSHMQGVNGLILDCGFSSPYQQILYEYERRHLPKRLMMPIMRLCGMIHLKKDIKQEVSASLEQNQIPAFFIHGKADETVPYQDGLKNYQSCGSIKELLLVPGAPHTAGLYYAGETGKEKIKTFIRKCEEGFDEISENPL